MIGYCQRCGKKPGRAKWQQRNAERYAPFCSYDCQQWWNLAAAQAAAQEHLAALKETEGK